MRHHVACPPSLQHWLEPFEASCRPRQARPSGADASTGAPDGLWSSLSSLSRALGPHRVPHPDSEASRLLGVRTATVCFELAAVPAALLLKARWQVFHQTTLAIVRRFRPVLPHLQARPQRRRCTLRVQECRALVLGILQFAVPASVAVRSFPGPQRCPARTPTQPQCPSEPPSSGNSRHLCPDSAAIVVPHPKW